MSGNYFQRNCGKILTTGNCYTLGKDILVSIAIFSFLKINLFIIYFWLRWVFVAVRRLSLVATSGGPSSLRCVGFSLRWLLLLRSTGSSAPASVVVSLRLRSCGAQA